MDVLSAYGYFMSGMNKICDKHPWCTTKTTNIQNDFGIVFMLSSYIIICNVHMDITCIAMEMSTTTLNELD